MGALTVKLARIGNSRGIRLPAALIRRYGFGDIIKIETGSEGVLLTPAKKSPKLSWEQTAEEMAAASESWDEWATVENDGLASIPWESKKRSLRAK